MDFRSVIADILDLPIDASETTIKNALIKLTGKGQDTANPTKTVDPRQLALQAACYQAKLARSGITISHQAAVRAVHDGTTI